MGKKNRNNRESKHSKSKCEEDAITSSLLQKTSTLPASSVKELWDEHVAIWELLEKLEKLQIQKVDKQMQTRSDLLPHFSEWLKLNGGDSQKVAVFASSDDDCGVRASAEVQEGEKILSIPRKLILTSENSSSTFLGTIIENDKLLRMMPNVVLAVKLLQERHKKDSFWKPYIDVLPQTFNIPLYFNQEEICLLQGSHIFDSILNLYKSIARQYAYLYQLFKKIPERSKLEFMKSFSFSEYRWAVSIVMTRQNQIPSPSGNGSYLALIPFLDMCNHTQGQITTDYDLNEDCCICFALHHCQPEEQVFIFYGPRSNRDFFLHSGFFYEENEHDLLHLKLGISQSDSLYTVKNQLLSVINLNVNNIALKKAEFPLTKELLAFLRVFCISKEEGENLMKHPQDALAQLLFDPSFQVSKQNEEKMWSFLETRCLLILGQYPTTKEEDDMALESQDLSKNAKLAIKFRRSEKLLLLNAMSFCKKIKEKLSRESPEEK